MTGDHRTHQRLHRERSGRQHLGGPLGDIGRRTRGSARRALHPSFRPFLPHLHPALYPLCRRRLDHQTGTRVAPPRLAGRCHAVRHRVVCRRTRDRHRASLSMKLIDWIFVGVIAALFVAAVVFLVRQKKRGGCIGCSSCSSVRKKDSRTACAGCTKCTGCAGCCDSCPARTACGEKSPAEGDAHSPLSAAKTEDEPRKDRPEDSGKDSSGQSSEKPSNE